MLNEEQKKAVEIIKGPLLIVAGAGTGKTTVIVEKIKNLINKGVRPENILALTFTEKAAFEMEERVDKAMPYGYFQMWISTFHSFADKILNQHGLDIGLPINYKVLDQTASWMLVPPPPVPGLVFNTATQYSRPALPKTVRPVCGESAVQLSSPRVVASTSATLGSRSELAPTLLPKRTVLTAPLAVKRYQVIGSSGPDDPLTSGFSSVSCPSKQLGVASRRTVAAIGCDTPATSGIAVAQLSPSAGSISRTTIEPSSSRSLRSETSGASQSA